MPADPTWFYWPITSGTLASAVGIHAYSIARRNGRTTDTAVLGSVRAVSAIAVPALLLHATVTTECNDEGHGMAMSSWALGWPLVAALSLVGIGCLYRWLGATERQANVAVVLLSVFGGLGLLLESVLSFISLEVYCGGRSTSMYTQLGVAVGFVVFTTAVAVWRCRSS